MRTLRLDAANPGDIILAVETLKNGGLTALPTETVYGLAANAFDAAAVGRIFHAKGRPQDNPLIVHVANADAMGILCKSIPQKAFDVIDAFWPGPLTVVLPRSERVPDEVAAGLETVAVRCPAHPVALRVLELSKLPLAAPSANRSGLPSPTRAEHVLLDLDGRIDAVLDGGPCVVGVESTVLDLCSGTPSILRPGAVTKTQLEAVLGHVEMYSPKNERKPRSPGMKYRHYAPSAPVVIVNGDIGRVAEYIDKNRTEKTAVLCFDDEVSCFSEINKVSYGNSNDYTEQMSRLFGALRELDTLDCDIIYARCPENNAGGAAVFNRLQKAAGYKVLEIC